MSTKWPICRHVEISTGCSEGNIRKPYEFVSVDNSLIPHGPIRILISKVLLGSIINMIHSYLGNCRRTYIHRYIHTYKYEAYASV
jgi:hypothetical protein